MFVLFYFFFKSIHEQQRNVRSETPNGNRRVLLHFPKFSQDCLFSAKDSQRAVNWTFGSWVYVSSLLSSSVREPDSPETPDFSGPAEFERFGLMVTCSSETPKSAGPVSASAPQFEDPSPSNFSPVWPSAPRPPGPE